MEVCNPLGSKAGKHKLDMYYYTLANLSPKLRSRHCAIRLLAISNSKFVKKYGISKIMDPIVRDLNKLFHGVNLQYKSESFDIFGKVVICTGDTLGQHLWGGLKEGVVASFQKCRTCYCQFDEMQNNFKEELFALRTKASYNDECSRIENALNDNIKNNLRTIYGINERSILSELPGFDVTKQLPQDIMHTILEGVLQYELRLLFLHYISNHQLKLEQINLAILNHDYGYSEVSDKPGPLKEVVFTGNEAYKLRYTAAQARLFARLLPFIIAPFVDIDNEYHIFMIELIQITQIIFSPVIHINTVQYLRRLIEEHLVHFKSLFPEKNILPKQHYMIHLPSMITTVGPLTRSACFSFEAAHNYFKVLARKQNFKNITQSLAKRCQLLECSNFIDGNDQRSHPLFSTEMKYGVLQNLKPQEVAELRKSMNDFGLLPGIELSIAYQISWVILEGTKYCKKGVIAVLVTQHLHLPIFGSIKKIYIVGDFVYFLVSLFNTCKFEYNYQAYLVEDDKEEYLCCYQSLIDYNVFHVKNDKQGNLYIPTKYDIDDLVEQHYKSRNPIFSHSE